MDVLTHVFLPLTAIYVIRPEAFASPSRFGLSGFGLVPDADKLVGLPGSFQSRWTAVDGGRPHG